MRSWSELPVGRVVRLDADAEAIAVSVDPLPPDAPAVLTYRPGPVTSVSGLVAAVLDELDAAAVALFPAWLPGAEGIEGPGGAHLPAVRALALRRAAASEHYGPFLAELAERALAGGPSRLRPEVRAAGLARALADSFGRSRTALLVRVPEGLTAAGQEVLVAACEWLAHRGALGVWLAGAPLEAVDRLETVKPLLPALTVPVLPVVPEPPRVSYPAPVGRPHPGSPGEQALEAALSRQSWAYGRAWNQTYQPHPLAVPIRLDLVWERERCVVEIDGDDHRQAATFAADRARDVRLQLDGYAVLRFLDVQVLTDTTTVINSIARFLRNRRGTEG
ncbi:DUF559 domain-containing protein [Nonomuraea sp. NPDC049421]|uniref:endonuclease domain-containing protein n=1 Tax=Nonomuraea sp. NPDC049421 TaxID=3155275 RepID=UPI00341EAE1B